MKNEAGSFLKGATILTAAGILSRLLGLFFKVPLYQFIGSFGNGIFYNVTNIYNLLLMVSTIGIPTAISKMISENLATENHKGVKRVFEVSFLCLFAVGLVSTLILFFGANLIIQSTGWPEESYWSIMAIAPAPLIISVVCAYRGYFQGHQMMNPTAISQIIEQIVRVALGLILAYFGARVLSDIGLGVAGSIFGATAGGFVALVMLFFMYHRFIRRQTIEINSLEAKPYSYYLKRLLYIAIPITLTSAIVQLFSVFDSAIYVPRLAKAGIDAVTATEMVGDLGNAEILINIPLVISGNLAVAIIPSISESFILGDKKLLKEKINLALELILIIALPCCVGLSVLSSGLFDLLFPGSTYGGDILRIYAYITLFMMLSNTFQSALQGIDRFRLPLYSLLVGSVIRFVSAWIFLSIPSINIYGIVFSGLLTFGFLSIANYLFLKHYSGVEIEWKQLIKLILASAVMGLCVYLADRGLGFFLPNVVSLLIAILVGVGVYLIMVLVTGALTPEIIDSLPGSSKLRPYYEKFASPKEKFSERKLDHYVDQQDEFEIKNEPIVVKKKQSKEEFEKVMRSVHDEMDQKSHQTHERRYQMSEHQKLNEYQKKHKGKKQDE